MQDDFIVAIENGPESRGMAPANSGLLNLIAVAALWGAANFCLGLLSAYLLHQLLPPPPNHMAAAGRILSSPNWFSIAFAALLWAPVFETIIGQLIPIELLRRFNASHAVILITCGVIFGAGHYVSNGLIHGLRTVVSGVLLAELYCRYRKHSMGRSYLAVVLAHSFTNLWVLVGMALGYS